MDSTYSKLIAISTYMSVTISIHSYVGIKGVKFNVLPDSYQSSYWVQIIYDIKRDLTLGSINVLVKLPTFSHNLMRFA